MILFQLIFKINFIKLSQILNYKKYKELLMKLFDLSHFKENCPTEAKNYFKEIIMKLEKIEIKLEKIENKI